MSTTTKTNLQDNFNKYSQKMKAICPYSFIALHYTQAIVLQSLTYLNYFCKHANLLLILRFSCCQYMLIIIFHLLIKQSD